MDPFSISDIRARVSTDLESVFEFLLEASRQQYGQPDAEVLILESQYLDFEKNVRLGVVSIDDSNRIIAIIRKNVLDLIESRFNKKTLIGGLIPDEEWSEKELKLKNITDTLMLHNSLAHVEKEFNDVFWKLRIGFLMTRNCFEQIFYLNLKRKLNFLDRFERENGRTDEIRRILYKKILELDELVHPGANNNDLVRLNKLVHKFAYSGVDDMDFDKMYNENILLFQDFRKLSRNGVFISMFNDLLNLKRLHIAEKMLDNLEEINNRFREMVVRLESIKDAI